MPSKYSAARRERHKKYMKKYLADPANHKKHMVRIKRNRLKALKRVDALIAVWKKNGCALCKEKEVCCLHAHHIDPSKKEHTIGNMRKTGHSLAKVEHELAKCVCLCANCHMKVHAGVLTLEAST